MDLVFIGDLIEIFIPIFISIFFGLAYFSKEFRKKYVLLKEKHKLWYLLAMIIGILSTIIRSITFLK